MENIIVQEMAGNAPMMLLMAAIFWKLDKRLTILETLFNQKAKAE